jgi:hypothetical protein
MRRSRPVSVQVGRGALRLAATACRAGDDLAVTVTGGDLPHLGCVVIARPHPAQDDPGRTSVTSSIFAFPPHREEALARPLAERLARRLGGTVVVAAGVHIDGLDEQGIANVLELGDRLADRLLSGLKVHPSETPRRSRK